VESYAEVITGMTIGDNDKYLRLWPEIDFRKISISATKMDDVNLNVQYWFPYSKGGPRRQWFGNQDYVVNWRERGNFNRAKTKLSHLYLRDAIVWPFIPGGKFSARYLPYGSLWDVAGSPCFFDNEDDMYYVLSFLCSSVANYYLSVVNPTVNVQAADIKNLPLLLSEEEQVVKIAKQNIEISKSDWDAHETSWGYKGNEIVGICGEQYGTISCCVKSFQRRWEDKLQQIHNNEEQLNKLFIDAYGLQNEICSNVLLSDITILQSGEVSYNKDSNESVSECLTWNVDIIMKQLISYAVGCWMGRYRLDKEGLNIAYYPKDDEICTYDVNGHPFTIDDDGIIPLMPHQNPFEDDNALQKIVNFVKMVFGADNLTENLNYIEHCLGKSIEDYMMKDFWKDHLKMYQNRPIYWLFSSKKGAFQVLVYMHRMNPYTAEKVRTKYLLPYIDYLESKIQQDRDRGVCQPPISWTDL
jgi:hypothetical protein